MVGIFVSVLYNEPSGNQDYTCLCFSIHTMGRLMLTPLSISTARATE